MIETLEDVPKKFKWDNENENVQGRFLPISFFINSAPDHNEAPITISFKFIIMTLKFASSPKSHAV